ncbi:sensor histidine kinase [Paenibacillus thalictri]|uniref:histidine kinase n=1 Tax=Paenibacillus thalictri TaxID=2527873 RepID=A0A4Q9DJJ8_9BACL|nr:HAMP domain-containing sensor histidine kinase [Paenibacillus thalictri]TBL71613.1 HAMP domain-containing histidine kinase [Paenibacillus thalictri]
MNVFFRRMNVILFVALQGSFLLMIGIIVSVFNINWGSVFDKYQQDQLAVNAYKMIDDMRNEQMTVGPFDEDAKLWLNRRATLYGVLIRYGAAETAPPWFDMFSRMDKRDDMVVQSYPLIDRGVRKGDLQVGYLKTLNELDPNVIAYQQTMRSRSAWLFGIVAVLSVFVSYYVAKLLSRHLQKLQETAELIRYGNRTVYAPVQGPEEVRRLAAALNELSKELKKQEDWRHQLMEDLTHELRTPLTSILTQLEAMIDGIYEVSQERLSQMYEELIRLSRLMNDMERLSEAEAAQFTIVRKRTNVVQLTETVYRNFQAAAKAKGIRLEFYNPNVPCYAEVDRDKIVQVISNIVSNAIKYTSGGGHIVLGVNYSEDTSIIFCKDTGIGISKEDLPYVFNRLFRADKSRSRFSGGVGLGLSIAKALAEAHQGTIEAESEAGKGSVFRVTIPNRYKSV